ncbi:MAG: hypothetical protein A2Y74_03165 [Actinobacteria bacterium RBG_13_63_9]|nr:MAG: hypothetical protein A2Y74_03165 [Actinobacteria bacterium RBG_13_63_9]
MRYAEYQQMRRRKRRRLALLLLVVVTCVAVVAVVFSLGARGCGSGASGSDGGTTTSLGVDGTQSGNIDGGVGVAIQAGNAVITVSALQDAFQPAMPVQKLSEEALTAPDAGEGFYQAYVRVENKGDFPLRVDAEDFACAIGSTVANIEPTRSGPTARSLIKGTSLDLVLTFKGSTGYEPILIYSPPWYDGIIRVGAQVGPAETTTTTPEATTTTAAGQ